MDSGYQVITTAEARAAGVRGHRMRRLCGTKRWRRLFRGTYLAGEPPLILPDELPYLARVRAAVRAQGPAAVAVLETSAWLHGIPGAMPGNWPIHLALPPDRGRSQRPGVQLHWWHLAPADVCEVAGIATTTAVRTIADLLLRLPRARAVSVVDAALHLGVLPEEDVPVVFALLHRRKGARAARRHLLLADGRAESPLETRVRLACIDGRVAPEELQWPVRADGGLVVGRADLAWPSRGVVAEADGAAFHGAAGTPLEPLFQDRRRQNGFAGTGLRVLRSTWADTRQPARIAATVRRALHLPPGVPRS